jgi:hypothetical protein
VATKKVYVSRMQRDAAKRIVARSASTGRYVSSAVKKVADAVPPPYSRSAASGRYVTQAAAARHPTTTVAESANGPRSTTSSSRSKQPPS